MKKMSTIVMAVLCTLIIYANDAKSQSDAQTLSYSHGKYVGEVANGKANGQGTYTSTKSGVTYSGQFLNDTFNGKGTMTWGNGDKFVGTWQNDMATSGTMTFANGKTENGTVKNGVFKASSATAKSTNKDSAKGNKEEDANLIGQCLGYLASQIQNNGIQNLHPTHQKYFSNHKSQIATIQTLNKSHPNCFSSGVMIGDCLQSKGVSRIDIGLAEGFNTGIVMNKQADSATRTVFEAACMN